MISSTRPAQWIIAPNEGLLPGALGASPQEGARLLGEVRRSRALKSGGFTEYRPSGLPTVNYYKDAADYIAMGSKGAPVVFEGVDVFAATTPEAMRAMFQVFEAANGAPAVYQLGFLFFLALNVSFDGFYFLHEDAYFDPEHDQDDRVVVVQTPGTLEIFETSPSTERSFF